MWLTLLIVTALTGLTAMLIHIHGKKTDAQWMLHMRQGNTPEDLARFDAMARRHLERIIADAQPIDAKALAQGH